jgi:hypothetical protein
MNSTCRLREFVRQPTSSIRGVVIDDEYFETRILLEHFRNDQRKVLRLVVGRNDYDPTVHAISSDGRL